MKLCKDCARHMPTENAAYDFDYIEHLCRLGPTVCPVTGERSYKRCDSRRQAGDELCGPEAKSWTPKLQVHKPEEKGTMMDKVLGSGWAIGLIVFALIILSALAARAETAIYPIEVERVLDGDTFHGTVEIWPGMTMKAKVRIKGIDTPEVRRPSKECEVHERELGAKAGNRLRELLTKAEYVMIAHVQLGKYAGRVVADVIINDKEGTRPVAKILVEEGLARYYTGGKRESWCSKHSGRAPQQPSFP